MGSTRLPGKSLYLIKGKPMLQYLLDSLIQYASLDSLVIATSTNIEDDKIKEFGNSRGVYVFRGDPINVASRFRDILIERPRASCFVRINGDSPLLDYRLVAQAEELFCNSEVDIVSSVINGSLPSGMNVEVIKSETFIKAYNSFAKPEHFEHVTRYFYENKELYTISGFPRILNNTDRYKFAIDTMEDMERMTKFIHILNKPHYYYALKQKCEIYDTLL